MNAALRELRGNLRKIAAYRFLSDFYLLLPVLIPYYHACGLNATDIFIVQASYSLTIMLFEIPSGYLSDVLGRRMTLLIGAILMPLALTLYALSTTLPYFIAAEIILAIAGSMRSGTDSAMLFDTLTATGEEARYTEIEGRAEAFLRYGTAVSSLIGGALALYFLRLPFFANILSGLCMVAVAFPLVEPPRAEKASGKWPLTEMGTVVRSLLTDRAFVGPALLFALVGSVGVAAVWAYLLRFEAAGLSPLWSGLLFACFQLSSAFGSRASHLMARGAKGRMPAYILIIPMVLFLFAVDDAALLAPVACLHALVWGLSTPYLLAKMNACCGAAYRATSLSTATMLTRLFNIILMPVIGVIVDATSLAYGFLFLAAVLLAGTIVALRLLVIGGKEAAL